MLKFSKRTLLLSLSLFLLGCTLSQAQTNTNAKATLTASDVDLFIKSFNPLKEDLEKLGHRYENMNHNTITALSANEEVQAIFKKHGWSDNYFPKISAIVYAYSYLKSSAEIEKLPADQKKLMEPMFAPMKAQFATLVHLDDIQVVKKKFAEVDQFFEKQ